MLYFGHDDIVIQENCDKNFKSQSKVGGTYKPSDGKESKIKSDENHLGGKHKFKVTEIEVYSVIIN